MLRRITLDDARVRADASALPNVDAIVDAVRRDGDAAVIDCARRFGDAPPRRIPAEEVAAARAAIDPKVAAALASAAERIDAFARAQRAALRDVEVRTSFGTIGHRFIPVRSALAYVPAGRYPLPSSLLMSAIPARVAGVERIAVATPRAHAVTLAAAALAGVTEVWEIGGAQAIAAFAYGTETIAPVDTIVGPGNAYVAAAKRAVLGRCGIDAIAGPSEVLVVASGDADPRIVAFDLLAQAEHDLDARPLLLTDDDAFALAVDRELQRALETLPTADVARTAIARNGWCCVAPLDARAVALIDAIAPEHLELQGRAAEVLRDRVRSYGALFVGAASAESFGDYGAGPNHVLPTNGTARFSSGLSVLTFLTVRTYQEIRTDDADLVEQTATLARAEGLEAHARAAEARYSMMVAKKLSPRQ